MLDLMSPRHFTGLSPLGARYALLALTYALPLFDMRSVGYLCVFPINV